MTDQVYPSAKPAPPISAKPHPYRYPYRPNQRQYRSKRSCLCCFCFWSILTFTLLVLLAAIFGCFAYVVYSPRRPIFTVASVKILRFNLTNVDDTTTHLSSSVNITLSAKNPNKRITYSYDMFSVSLYSHGTLIANGSFPSFVSYSSNTDIIRSTVSSASDLVDVDNVSGLKSDLKRKHELMLRSEMDTNVVVKMGKFKTRKVGIRVVCEGIKGILPKGKSVLSSSVDNAKCKVDLRIKIWKFTL